MNTTTGGIPRYRSSTGPALLQEGFRPFFLGAALWSALALCLWLGSLAGHVALPTAFDALTWHAHEMIFGFAAATVSGFLLTAIPNWTGRLPLQGGPLAALALTWLAGRAAIAVSAWIGALPAAAIDLAFLVLLLMAVLREIAAGRNWRNLPMPAALGLLIAANLLVHIEAIGMADT
ncbi:MAG: NnrS family protein, partial [Dongiaceae bacterium]